MSDDNLPLLATAPLRRGSRNPRAMTTRYGVMLVVHRTGERVPTLIDYTTGLPPVVALRYALSLERRRAAHTTLRAKLRRIGDLYEWYAAQGRDLDALILDLGVPTTAEWTQALQDLDSAAACEDDKVVGAIEPAQAPARIPGIQTAPARNPAMWNRRVGAWAAFGQWLARPAKWKHGEPHRLRRAQHQERRQFNDDLADWANSTIQMLGTSAGRLGFTSEEMEALLACVQPDTRGRFPDGLFSPAIAERVWLIFGLAYYAGLRLGEICNLHIDDVPARHEGVWQVRVRRRNDDPGEVRADAPGVKRGGREPDIPGEFYRDLRRYIERTRPKSPHPDLLVTAAGEPLSYWTAVDMGRRLRAHTVERYDAMYPLPDDVVDLAAREPGRDRKPGGRSTLGTFSWHRLRHTRARELLPRFVDAENRVQGDALAFCNHFGWASLKSADPYIWELQQAQTADVGAKAMANAHEPYPLRRDV